MALDPAEAVSSVPGCRFCKRLAIGRDEWKNHAGSQGDNVCSQNARPTALIDTPREPGGNYTRKLLTGGRGFASLQARQPKIS